MSIKKLIDTIIFILTQLIKLTYLYRESNNKVSKHDLSTDMVEIINIIQIEQFNVNKFENLDEMDEILKGENIKTDSRRNIKCKLSYNH